jgi:pSer/pThr/pTyr-binding forkhead associated (FHA) protein/lysophospholipase L1-like esterase
MTAMHSQPSAALIIRQGSGVGQRFAITEPAVTVGRHRSCDIPVEDPEMSRQHARITWSGTGYVVEDLGSANGTFVNGQRISGPHTLKDSDLLRLGKVEFAFQSAEPPPSDEMPTMAGVAAPTGGEPVAPPARVPPPEPPPARVPPPKPPPTHAPPPNPPPAEKKGFPSLTVVIGALVLLCLCLALAGGGYWLWQRNQQEQAAGTLIEGDISPQPPLATAVVSPLPSGATPQPPATSEAVSAPPGQAPPPGAILWPIDAAMKEHLRQIMQEGQARGMRISVFAKVGDSISESMAFLNDYCCGWYDLGPSKELEDVIQYFAATHVDELEAQTNPYHTSFDRMSLVAVSGAQASFALEGGDGSALMQEINAIKPGLAIIMFGTNEALAGEDVATYKDNLKQIVAVLKKEGIIPILSTIPDLVPPAEGGERIPAFNQAVKEVALEEQVPLMDYWQALQPLPNKGLDADGIHPNVFMVGEEYHSSDLTEEALQYGYNVRNKLALEMLAKVKAIVIDDGPPDGAAGPVAEAPPATTAPPPPAEETAAPPPPTSAPEEPAAQPQPPSSGPPAGGDFRRIIFLHHSCGANLIEQGGVRQLLTALGYEFYDHGYNGDGLVLADGTWTGTNFDVPDDNTDPDGFNNIFAQPLHDPPDNTFSHLMQYDVIAFKSCFPTSNIGSDEQLEEYKTYYRNIRAVMDQYPNKIFIVVTQPPQVPDSTDPGEAARARAFATWLASPEYLDGHPNVFTFNFFDYLADPSTNTLRAEYQVDPSDGHPNELANQTIAPHFADFIDQAIKTYSAR